MEGKWSELEHPSLSGLMLLKWEAYLQSNTAWDIFKLQDETPETVLSGTTFRCIFYLSGVDLYRQHTWVLDNPVS